MQKFRFKLQTVLNHRQRLEERAMQAFAEAQGQLAACDGRIAALKSEFASVAQDRPAIVGGDWVEQIGQRERHLDTLRLRQQQEEELREALAVRREEARQGLVHARQQREIAQRLREIALDEHRRLVGKAEQEAVDEMATIRFNRK